MSILPLLFILLLMLYFMNSFYYIMALLFSMAYVLCFLTCSNSISTVFSLMIVLVYAGAMMIFIGYVCAVSPNPIFSSSFSFNLLLLSLVIGSFFTSSIPVFCGSDALTMMDFFYTSDGFFILLILVFMLFMTLILVSAQHFTPKGPFRSV